MIKKTECEKVSNVQELISNLAMSPQKREVLSVILTESQDIIVLPDHYILENYSGQDVVKIFTYATRNWNSRPPIATITIGREEATMFKFGQD